MNAQANAHDAKSAFKNPSVLQQASKQDSQQLNQQKSSCLLLEQKEQRMLVPRMLVAEVIKCSFVDIVNDEELGLSSFDWRGCQVPLVKNDFNGIKEEESLDEEARVIIFYGLKDSQKLPFYAITVIKSPQLLQVSADDLEEKPDQQLSPEKLMKVMVNGLEAFIPKVDYFENITLEKLQLLEQ